MSVKQKFCKIKVCEMDHKKSKKCLKIANEEIFIAFTYLLIDFVLLWHKITKIENAFKTHN